MSYSCEFCPGRVFALQKGLKPHQKQEKCGKKKWRSLSPTNPLLKFFRKKKANFPSIDEAPEKIVRPRKVKAELKVKFEREVSEIINAVVPADADRNSQEYRSKIRAHYDSLKERFPQLTCTDYARANTSRLTARNFQKWCTSSKRADDKAKIKKNASQQRR